MVVGGIENVATFFLICHHILTKKSSQYVSLMFDPIFKGIQIVTKFLNNSSKMLLEFMVQYDQKALFPFLTKTQKKLHLEMAQPLPHVISWLENSLFGVTTSIKKVNESLLGFELSFFPCIPFTILEIAKSLLWWKVHATQFSLCSQYSWRESPSEGHEFRNEYSL